MKSNIETTTDLAKSKLNIYPTNQENTLTPIQRIICETQGEIFRCANEWRLNMDEFVPLYMHSVFCKRAMDGIYSRFQMADGEECLDYILKEIHPSILNEIHYNEQAMFWVGFTYRQLTFRLRDIPSKIIYDRLPFFSLAKQYYGLHTIDEEIAIDIIIENRFEEYT